MVGDFFPIVTHSHSVLVVQSVISGHMYCISSRIHYKVFNLSYYLDCPSATN